MSAAAAPAKREFPNNRLMREMESDTGLFEPMPPNQYRSIINNPKSAAGDRLLAWLWSQTIAPNRFSAYAVDEHAKDEKGKPHWFATVQAAMGWRSEQTARDELNELAKRGLIRLEHKAKRIKLLAKTQPQTIEEETKGGTKDEELNSVQTYYGVQIVDFIENLPPEEGAELKRRGAAAVKWFNDVCAEAMAAARAKAMPIVDSVAEEFGFHKERQEQRRPEVTKVRLELLDLPSVQKSDEPFCTTDSEELYRAESASVQQDASLCVLDIGLQVGASSSSPLGVDEMTQPRETFTDPGPTEPPLRPNSEPENIGAAAFRKRVLEIVVAKAGMKIAPDKARTDEMYRTIPRGWHATYLTEAEDRAPEWKTLGILMSDVNRFVATLATREDQAKARGAAADARAVRANQAASLNELRSRYADYKAKQEEERTHGATDQQRETARARAAAVCPNWRHMTPGQKNDAALAYLLADVMEGVPSFDEWRKKR